MNVASRLPDSSAAALADRQKDAVKPPFLGFGLGLRHQHYDEILAGNPPIDWFEVISENYMLPGGQPLRVLDQIRERYPVVMHGVSLSIASTASSAACSWCRISSAAPPCSRTSRPMSSSTIPK